MKVFVGCSSRDEISDSYKEGSKELLEQIFKENDLVFGACNSGIMGEAYKSALQNGREITGICPEAYKDDFTFLKCNKEILTSSIFERTKKLIDESDMLLFLPGGIGTYSELFSAIESKRCYEHDKPIVLFNLNGFFDKFIEMLNQNYEDNFSKGSDKYNYVVLNTVKDTVDFVNNYERTDYKQTYLYGLALFKDSLSEVTERPYTAILPYFDYPLSVIEKEVEEAENKGTASNLFYRAKCDDLLKMYDRFLKTSLICKHSLGTKEEKKMAEDMMNILAGKEVEKSSKRFRLFRR